MSNIEFENRAVAFLDVLGFKSVVDAATSGGNKIKELKDLISLLETVVPNLDGTVDSNVPRDLIPKYIYISDSIILSAPLESDKMPNYRGLLVLVMRIIQINQILLRNGYLIRGGVSVGPVWHIDSNIVGTAYQEAYLLETKTLVPRVELSSNAKAHWIKTEDSINKMCLDYKDKFIVNVLHDYYISDMNSTKEDTFIEYLDIIQKKMNDIHSEHINYKLWWFKQYIENEASRNNFNIRT